ncbi:MAG: hypothetical protein R6V67_08890 [Spirochaetia bacterium]
MRHTGKKKIKEPLHTPTGERIYELIGGKEETGGTKLHSLAQVELPAGKTSAPHYHGEREETLEFLAVCAPPWTPEDQYEV